VAGAWRQALPDGTTREDVPDAVRLYNPDGSKQERTDDGVNTFTNGEGSWMTVRSDGSVAASPDISLRASPDGGVEGTTPQGQVVTATSDGSLSVKSTDGTVRGIGGDGTTFVQAEGWSIVTSPDGANSTATANLAGGVIVGVDSSGTVRVGTPDRQVTFRGDGTVVIDRPEGEGWSTAVRFPDGTKQLTTPDGVTFVSSASGEVIRVVYADGTVVTPDDDGTLDEVVEGAAEILTGAWEEIEGTAEAVEIFAPLALTLLPGDLGRMIAPEAISRAQGALLATVQMALDHPVDFAKALLDWDTWKESPLRAIGHLLPGILIAIATGGAAGAASKAEKLAGAAAKVGAEGAGVAAELSGEAAGLATKVADEGASVATLGEKTAAGAAKIDDVPGGVAKVDDAAAATKAPDQVSGVADPPSAAAPGALGDPAQAWKLNPIDRGREIQRQLSKSDYAGYIETDTLPGYEKAKNFPLVDFVSPDNSHSVSLKTYDPSTGRFGAGETLYDVQEHAEELVGSAPGTRVTLDIRVPDGWPQELKNDLRDTIRETIDDPDGRLDVVVDEFP
jgi:hypothetical protein